DPAVPTCFPTRRSCDLLSSPLGKVGLSKNCVSGHTRTNVPCLRLATRRPVTCKGSCTAPPEKTIWCSWPLRQTVHSMRVDSALRSEEHTSELQSRFDVV